MGLGRFMLDCIFPRKCLSCGAYSVCILLCDNCRPRLSRSESPSRIQDLSGPPVISPFFTGEVLLEIVRFMKFEGGTIAASWLGSEMAAALSTQMPRHRGDVIVPVPLHWMRLARRGYDQAALLSEEISRFTGIPVGRRILRRRKRTRAQSSLDHGKRRGNIDGAFKLLSSDRIRNRHVVLVDDLVTTGETAMACCRALGDALPSAVTVLCAGRKRPVENKVECSEPVVFE